MLSSIPVLAISETVWRYASAKDDLDTLTDMGIDISTMTDILKFLKDNGMLSMPDDLLEGPFRRKLMAKGTQSRYSDGSFPVFYSAIEPATASDEISYHGKRIFFGKRVYYNLFHCLLKGNAKDLRPNLSDWPELKDKDDYAFCNAVAKDAINEKLDCLLVPSARNESGTCTPVFNRPALSASVIKDIITFDF